MISTRPDPSEYAPYYETYVSLVPDEEIGARLENQLEESLAPLAAVPPDRETFRYAEGKWSIREAVGHIVECERVFANRALWISRVPAIELPGMEQDA